MEQPANGSSIHRAAVESEFKVRNDVLGGFGIGGYAIQHEAITADVNVSFRRPAGPWV
jgi:hypothetical protein